MTLPNFLIAGAPRSGTTSLYNYLRQHSEVFGSLVKEPKFFSYDPSAPETERASGPAIIIRTIEEYENLFAEVSSEKVICEATPSYIYSPIAIQNISKTIPEVKLLFILRDPIARAYSSYWYSERLGYTRRSVEDILTAEHPHVTRGLYYHYLSKWYDQFSKSQIKVILTEDLNLDVVSTYKDICIFLEIDPNFSPDFTIRNKSGVPKHKAMERILRAARKSKLKKALTPFVPDYIRDSIVKFRDHNFDSPPPLSNDIVQRLAEFYQNDIVQLEGLIDRDLSAWKHVVGGEQIKV